MSLLLQGARVGVGFGLAIAAVSACFQLLPFFINRIEPSVSIAAFSALFEIVLVAVIGALLCPLLRLRFGRLLHLGVLAAAFTGLQLAYELDSPIFSGVARYGWLAGLALYGAGSWLEERTRFAGVAAGLVLLSGAIVMPNVFLALTMGERAVLAELPPAAPGAPDVVLIVLDTVRAESMSAYGYERETTPRFDALAKQGVLYLDATSPSTWSLASHASLFTGLFPSTHGAHMEHRFLGEGPPTLAETLASAGYETFTFTANAFISDSIGLTRGFRVTDESWRSAAAIRQTKFAYRVLDSLGFGLDDKGGGLVATRFEEWASRPPASDRPFFVFLNFIEAHFPYHQLPAEYLHLFSELPRNHLRTVSMDVMGAQFGGSVPPAEVALQPSVDMYDAGIVYTDHLLGRVIDALQRRGTLDDTILIVMSDHGELVGEHGRYGHGAALYEPGIRVPLLLRYPPSVRAGVRVETPISTVGVYATITDLLGLEPPGSLHVSSLIPVIDGGPPGGPVLAERHMAPVAMSSGEVDPVADMSARIRSYRAGPWKLIETSKGRLLLFDLNSDPEEAQDLADARPDQLARLREELDTWQSALGLPALEGERDYGAVPELDPGARERLRALGYLE